MKKMLMIMATLMLVLLVACSPKEDAKKDDVNKAAAVTIKTTNGDVKVPKNPEKVIVLDYGVLDTMDALGVGDTVVGMPREGVPSYLKKYDTDKVANLGGLKEIDIEKVNELKPDLIISSGRLAEMNDKLGAIAPTIQLSVDTTDYLNSLTQNTTELAKVFSKETAAETELGAINEKVKTFKAKVPTDKTALIILANEGKASAYGSQSRFGLIHDVLGFTPADKELKVATHGQSVSFEYISEKNPDYLFVVDRSAAIGGEASGKKVVENELVETTNAYKNKHVVYLNPEVWYLGGGGLESVNEMIDEVGAVIK
ncbi:siderophore ABC transporter substrate-binding protein [Brochothrix campestris]|uniref:Petrobactin ABC transporter substrate-binding protein YclQ n=1 Tax=Brochothrix campestris FSL F6-1037 TaxID=1265861 RepID=W7CPY3_9LIST|nr:siderophore ABC transporter substrate-binding protein [Brochothrix campestris]EUJ37746.1 petrobactin ABC transporter substrate-binding protein YclQ [Brochothrix campestris FSL F6-1037]